MIKFSLESIHKISVNSKEPIFVRICGGDVVDRNNQLNKLREMGHKVTIYPDRVKIEWLGAKA